MIRTKKTLAVMVAAAAIVAATVLATSAAQAESNGGVRVMPLGDSITDGFNVPGGYRIGLWQQLVAGGYTVDFVGSGFNGPTNLGDHDHEGHSGWRIDQLDANITNWLTTTTPRTVLLHIGTNDVIQNVNLPTAPARLSTLIDHITTTAPNAEVFVATIIPLPGSDAAVRTFNAAIPGLVSSKASAGRHVHLVDMYSALTSADLADGIHPNATGYGKMAGVWYNALRSVPGSLGNGTPPTTRPPTSPPATTRPSTSPPVTTRPPTNPPVTTRPPTTSPGQAGACSASYAVVGNWNTGYQAEVTVRNPGSSVLNRWTVRLTLASGQTIVNLWNGVNTGTTGAVSVRDAGYNATIAGGGSTAFGFVANGNGTSVPTGIACSSP